MKLSLLILIIALVPSLPLAHSAEPRKKTPRATPAPDSAAPAKKKEPRSLTGRALPYRVKVTAIDERAATFSSTGNGGAINVFAVTDKTVITKDSKPALFTDLAVGSVVTGTRTRTIDGKWDVASVNIQSIDPAPKPRGTKREPAKPAEKKVEEVKPSGKDGAAPAPAPADAAKPAEPKPDAKLEEKKPE